MILLTILYTSALFICFFGWLQTQNKLAKTQKLLEEAYKNTYFTPVKELAADFRDFVEGVDGKVSPEVEMALKKLEANEEPKALPTLREEFQKGDRPVLNSDMYKLFRKEFCNEHFGDDKIELVKHWGKKFMFSIEQQVKITNELNFGDEKAELRKYFDKCHNE